MTSLSHDISESFVESGGLGMCPSRRLMFAVLQRAILDFILYRNHEEGSESRQYATSAEDWIFGEPEVLEGVPRGVTFEYVCDVIGLDADRLREKLRTADKAYAQHLVAVGAKL